MFESILDFQFEVLTCYYNDGNELPVRSAVNSAHAYVAAPYGIYKTNNGYIALAMNNILLLATLLECDELKEFIDSNDWFSKRDQIKKILADCLIEHTTGHWLSILEKADIWCAPVMDYDTLSQQDGYKILNMEIVVKTSNGLSVTTTRCPLRVDGKLLISQTGAPVLGEHNEEIEQKFGLLKELEVIEKKNSRP
jgi:crotonobetainyl-CoA:carnitine CoA-transferase CaiB-like acyl-CoA transferase